MAPEDDDGRSRRIESKVARLIEEYGLGQQFGDQLETRWTADGEQRDSLRTLADHFNERLLEAAAADAGLSTVDGESANLYRLLTDDDVSGGNRTEARRRLEQAGVDVDQLEGDFVSYQAIRSYLTEYRNAEYDHEREQARPDRVVQTLQRLTERVRSVADRSLTQLRDTGRITLGEFRLFVDVSVLCEDCGSQYSAVELIRRGGCDCTD
ncbi:rod-determining factor RdfA [Halovenus halobia]|uniref:rod-determining factor RdfA n=1 Tax=Halovenus halobia TaxID=3396622 RepID=UPI003F554EE2